VNEQLPVVYLARHGETAWSISGQHEGLRTAEIHADRPDWELFRDGCPGGESPQQVVDRADRVVRRVRSVQGDVLLFSSGHFLRVLAARWLGFEVAAGRCFHNALERRGQGSEDGGLSQSVSFAVRPPRPGIVRHGSHYLHPSFFHPSDEEVIP
jgi:broad specificity phosphatase PhoE